MFAEIESPSFLEQYRQHWLHTDESDWPETNCYVDVWIELLNALGHEPLATMGFTIRTGLEADQWTFYKFRHHDLERFYGLEVAELNPWTNVLDQTSAEVRAGRPVLIEVDAFYLPDTAGVTYGTGHVKTTVAVLSIDADARTLTYAHNRSVHRLVGSDFDGIFHYAPEGAVILPPYIEIARLRASEIPAVDHGAAASSLLVEHLAKRPAANPFDAYRSKLLADLERMAGRGLGFFHDYAFSSYRQFGSAFFLAAAHLEWLAANDESKRFTSESLAIAAEGFRVISSTAKALQMKSSRTAVSGKIIDTTTALDTLAGSWDSAMRALDSGHEHRSSQ